MKHDVQNFIQNDRDYQLKDVVRIKISNQIILTAIPGAAFDKISKYKSNTIDLLSMTGGG